MKRFLAINPGSTSTKIALYEGTGPWELAESSHEELAISRSDAERLPDPASQLALRAAQIDRFLDAAGNPDLHAVVGRGGLTRPLEAGSYAINTSMKADLELGRYGHHASNLGALLAASIAVPRNITALIADPVGVDQFEEPARFSGWPTIERKSQLHALNIRSVARETARKLGGTMEDYNFVVAHLGGGISVAPMKHGRLVDVSHAMDGGPFSPQRTGALPLGSVVELAFSGEFQSARDMMNAFTRRGGLVAYLGTDDAREVMRRMDAGDAKAEAVYRAMAYQIAKEIGSMATVLAGKVDAIILTGGLARPPLSDWIIERCSWMAPVETVPGERELLALAQAAARHVCDGEPLREY